MKFTSLFLLLGILVSGIVACNNDDIDNTKSKIAIKEDADIASKTIASDAMEINSANMKDGKLNISVYYSGGAKDHSFEIIWSGSIENNTVELYLVHDSNDDFAEAWLNEKLVVNVNEISGDITQDTKIKIINMNDKSNVVTIN